MAWASAHFAVGMACSGAVTTAVCLFRRRGWHWLAPVMTLGGIWAMGPDLPRLFREDFPSLPFASVLGQSHNERWLMQFGNLFFFHGMMDAQPKEYALHGLFAIILLYNLAALPAILSGLTRKLSRGNDKLELESRHA